jgi:hypothetical protein
MVKETKAEQLHNAELEAEVSYQKFVREYPARFVAAMYEYLTLEYAGFRVHKLDAETYNFSVEGERWSDCELKVAPPANRNWEVVEALESVERGLLRYAAEQAEANRQYAVKQAALAKLSKEERELLGV